MINDDEDDFKSKSQLKREMHALQALGKRLTELKPLQLAKLSLTDTLKVALADFPKHHKHEAKRRQLQLIGKLMPDQNIEVISQFLAQLDSKSHESNQQLHQLENLRSQLLLNGDEAINVVLGQYHQADRNYLRKLVRKAHKEQQHNLPPVSSRKLFQYLKQLQQDKAFIS